MTSSAIFACTDLGVAAGTSSPYQTPQSGISKPSSFSVGRSGSAATRLSPATASARSLPSRSSGMAPASVLKVSGTRPPTTSVSAGGAPR